MHGVGLEATKNNLKESKNSYYKHVEEKKIILKILDTIVVWCSSSNILILL